MADTTRISVCHTVGSSLVPYNIDDVIVEEIPSPDDWKEQADARIEALRKGNVNIKYVCKCALH